jgi:hypothetical protein
MPYIACFKWVNRGQFYFKWPSPYKIFFRQKADSDQVSTHMRSPVTASRFAIISSERVVTKCKRYLKNEPPNNCRYHSEKGYRIMSARREDRPGGNPGYLRRGGACVSCRRRKMVQCYFVLCFFFKKLSIFDFEQRCDGKHPICSQCDRACRAEDCEYTTGQERSKVQILEDNISRLEARIQELQNPHGPVSRDLHAPQTPATTAMRLHQPYVVASNPSDSTIQDPPRQIAENLYVLFYQRRLFTDPN